MNWVEFYNKLISADNVTLDEHDTIVVYDEQYLIKLSGLINETLLKEDGDR